MTTQSNETHVQTQGRKPSYVLWSLLALIFWLMFLNGLSAVNAIIDDFSIKDASKQVIRGIGNISSGSTTVTDSNRDQIDIPDLDGVYIPDLITDPSGIGNSNAQPSAPIDTAGIASGAQATSIPIISMQPADTSSRRMPLPTASMYDRPISSNVVIKGIPDAAKMPAPTPYPTWPIPSPLPTSDYVFANLSKPGMAYYCVQVPKLGTQSCTTDPYILDNPKAQEDLARFLITGLITGDPIGTTP